MRGCVGAWVREWFPGCSVNPSARETNTLKEQEPVGDNDSPPCLPASQSCPEGSPNCSSSSFSCLSYPLFTAHCLHPPGHDTASRLSSLG